MKKEHALLDMLVSRYRLRNDAHLADELGYTKSRICEIRSLKSKVTDEFRCKVSRRFNLTLKQIDAVWPPKEKK